MIFTWMHWVISSRKASSLTPYYGIIKILYFCSVCAWSFVCVCVVYEVHTPLYLYYLLLINALCDIRIMTCLALSCLSHCHHPEIRSPHIEGKPAMQLQPLRKEKNNAWNWRRQCQHVCLDASADVLFSLCHWGLKMQSGIYLVISGLAVV